MVWRRWLHGRTFPQFVRQSTVLSDGRLWIHSFVCSLKNVILYGMVRRCRYKIFKPVSMPWRVHRGYEETTVLPLGIPFQKNEMNSFLISFHDFSCRTVSLSLSSSTNCYREVWVCNWWAFPLWPIIIQVLALMRTFREGNFLCCRVLFFWIISGPHENSDVLCL